MLEKTSSVLFRLLQWLPLVLGLEADVLVDSLAALQLQFCSELQS